MPLPLSLLLPAYTALDASPVLALMPMLPYLGIAAVMGGIILLSTQLTKRQVRKDKAAREEAARKAAQAPQAPQQPAPPQPGPGGEGPTPPPAT